MKVRSIYGPPGTGKTRTLVNIATEETGRKELRGGGLAYLSFSRTAAQEAVSRLPFATSVRASTIHSMAFNALGMNRAAVVDKIKLRRFADISGYPFQGSEENSDEAQEGDEYITVLQYANNSMMDLHEAYSRFGCPGTLDRFEGFVETYQSWKQTYGYMDFDDMIMSYVKNGGGYRPRVVILDEAQDCSPLQWAAMERICQQAERVYIAGDDDQAIFEWNGANPHGMIEFNDKHGGMVEVLDRSHRVPSTVLELAKSQLLANISLRVPKTFSAAPRAGTITRYGDFWDAESEIDRFNRDGGMILVRDRFRLDEVKRGLNRLMVPYDVIGGHSPWTSKVANDLRRGAQPDVPGMWREFYAQADLSMPVNIRLSTIHQAKGREADRVLVDLSLPTRALVDLQRARDAEIRVMYVAITRTAHDLILTSNNPII